MDILRQRGTRFSPDLSLVLLVALLVILWLTGGASRDDVSGQVISRAASWTAIVIAILFARRPRIGEAREPALILFAMILLCLAQLVPLPPGVWRALPGRAEFGDSLISPPDLWRPWSLVPGATANALFSLVVPLAMLVLVTTIPRDQKRWIPVAVLTVIGLALLVGLLQFTGAQISNPFVNGTPGAVDGLMANRNHFALLLAIGLLMTPVWGVGGEGSSRVRAPVALGLILLLVLAILASGSRAGAMLGMVALVLGLLLSRRELKAAHRRYSRWTFPAIGLGIALLVTLFVLLSVAAHRAVSIDRLLSNDAEVDLRMRALPTVLAMTRIYFPLGSGLGSFDPIFRMHEPFALLRPTYFNQAHDDFLEIVLTAGLPGLFILLAAVGWWLWRSVEAWRGAAMPPKLGSATLLLILLASIVDYPARTPLIMAMTIIAAAWLCETEAVSGKAPLPSIRRKL